MNKKSFVFIFVLFLSLSFLFSKNVFGTDINTIPEVSIKDSKFKAKYISQTVNDPIEIIAGETKNVIFKFQNVGNTTWDNSGANYISAYTMEERYHNSIFAGKNWLEPSQTAKMTPDKIAAKEFGEINVDFSVPTDTKAGEYIEKFYLAARNYSWLEGGYFYVKIKVVEKPTYVFKNYLYLEDEGEEVTQLQTKLKELGYFDHEITGYFGEVTKQAVIAFQKDNKLAPYPGWIGEGTRALLNNSNLSSKTNTQTKTDYSNVSDLIPTTEKDNVEVKTAEGEAKLVMINKKEIQAKGGERIKIILAYQNLSTEDWSDYSFVLSEQNDGDFSDDSWEAKEIILNKENSVEKWGIAKESFYINTPKYSGEYNFSIVLKIGDKILSDTITNIKVVVSKDASSNFIGSKYSEYDSEEEEEIFTPRFDEPTIRVGIWRDPDDGEVYFKSNEDTYIVYKGSKKMGELEKGKTAKMHYDGGIYTYETDELYFSTSNFIRLVPEKNNRAVFELTNYDRLVSWKGAVNFNTYRGVFEYRTTEDGSHNYVINELLLEDYVAGIGETSNLSDIDYIEALLTAARTYAYYTMTNTDKHASRYFDVVANTGDQLFLGYASEVLMPRVVEAANNTRGYMVTYKGEIVITPYYANSDGRTRSWTEVWGGSAKPWLVSVIAKYDKMYPKAMLGHGVGMSARDAAYMADREDVGFKDILKYYYTGVNVEKVYE
ncbi:MAG: peptidoglycan-binding protein [Patescibacteria group bacterium]